MVENHDLFTEAQEKRICELTQNSASNIKFPARWIEALEFVKKFQDEVKGDNLHYADMVDLFKHLTD